MTWTTRPRSEFGRLRAIRTGTGPCVVLLHGVGLRAEAWGAQIDDLATDHTVIAPDMSGHGDSAPLQGAVTLAAYTDLVAEALAKPLDGPPDGPLDGPAFVVGHSMGALIALDLAARYPAQVRGVAALNAIFERPPEASAAALARANALNGVSVAETHGTLSRWFGDAPSPERAACEGWLRAVDPAAYRDAYRVFASANGPTGATLRSLPMPALFCTGEAEPNSTPAMSHAMASHTANGRSVVISGGAHMMPMTHGAEVNTHLRRWLTAAIKDQF
ncbi:MAG: alpha/beta hydrolase [Roseicyclus sp.]|nr:alpha/beta hydrolase [Roseicyclus sp.]